MSLLSVSGTPTQSIVEAVCSEFLEYGVGPQGLGTVIIRSGAMGAYVANLKDGGKWVPAFWSEEDGLAHVVDVTGAGNSFLGGLAAGLHLTEDIYQATLYGTVSASFVIEQEGLPHMTQTTDHSGRTTTEWNGDSPQRRLDELQNRLRKVT